MELYVISNGVKTLIDRNHVTVKGLWKTESVMDKDGWATMDDSSISGIIVTEVSIMDVGMSCAVLLDSDESRTSDYLQTSPITEATVDCDRNEITVTTANSVYTLKRVKIVYDDSADN